MTEHLTDLLERAADDAPALRHDLVTDSMRRGTRLRHRRTALRMAGTSALVAAVVLGVTTIPRGETRGTGPEPPVVTPPKSSAPVTPDLTGKQAMPQVFAEYGEISQPWERTELETSVMTATLTDVTGASAGIAVNVYTYKGIGFPGAYDEDPPPTRCSDLHVSTEPPTDEGGLSGEYLPGFRCEELGNGALLVSYRSATYTDQRDDGEYANVVAVRYPDGFGISVRSLNSLGEKSGRTLDRPLLDVAQLKSVALDPLWRRVQLGSE